MTRPDTAPAITDRGWLRTAAAPGRSRLRAASTALIAWHTTGLALWAGIALLVAGRTPETGGPAGHPVALPLALILLGVLGRALAGRLARSRADRARSAIAATLRSRLLAATLPGRARPPEPGGAVVAHAVLELAEDVAGYHGTSTPPRRAALPAAVILLAAMAVAHWPAAVLLVLATPILPVNAVVVGLATRAAEDQQLDAVRRLSARLLDRFTGLPVLRTLDATRRERTQLAAASDGLRRSTAVVLRRAFVVGAVADVVVTFSVAVVATYVGLTLLGYLHVPGVPPLDLTGGMFVLLLAPAYFAPLRAMTQGRHERDCAEAAAAVLRPLLDHAGTAAADGPPPVLPGTGCPPEVELANLTVAHPGTPVLSGVTMTAPAGAWTAIEGPSGAGKTTLLDTVAGMIAPASGRVLVGGIPPQPGRANRLGSRTVVLPGTLAANLALGDPDADRAALERAAAGAGLGPLLRTLPHGLDTLVGAGGTALSAGEARRVAVARALLCEAELWLLDEPTAHLDAATEQAILDTLRQVTAGRTVLVVSHSAAVLEVAESRWRLAGGTLTPVPVAVYR